MIANNIEVTFITYGELARKFICDYVIFTLEFLGEVVEMFDDSLQENYRAVRQNIELKVKLNLNEAMFMAQFLGSTTKIIEIDGVRFEVVNDMQKVNFELFKKTIISVHPTLRFKVKNTGIVTPQVFSGAMGIGMTGVSE